MLVCQHLFNCQMKQQQIIYANVYRNTINDGDSQTSLLPIFSEGAGTSVHRRLNWVLEIQKRDDYENQLHFIHEIRTKVYDVIDVNVFHHMQCR